MVESALELEQLIPGEALALASVLHTIAPVPFKPLLVMEKI